MSKIVEKYKALMNEWSKLILDGKEKEGLALMESSQSIKDKFTKEDWQELIDWCPNTQAKIAWTEKMNELFPEK